jgi:hypothetical protein
MGRGGAMKERRLQPAELARLEETLWARGIGVTFLHRWCWRRGLALPPLGLMGFVGLFTVFAIATVGADLIAQAALWRLNVGLQSTLKFYLLAFVYAYLFAATRGERRIQRSVVYLLPVMVIYVIADLRDHPLLQPAAHVELGMVEIYAILVINLLTAASISDDQQARHREPWPDYWQGATLPLAA